MATVHLKGKAKGNTKHGIEQNFVEANMKKIVCLRETWTFFVVVKAV